MDSQAAIDTVAIQQLLAAYADVVNRRAFDELDELFLPDCEVVIDTRRGDPIVVTGGRGVGDFVGKAIERFDFFVFVILSARIWPGGADGAGGAENSDEATARLYMCEIRQERGTGKQSQAFGVYHDLLRRAGGSDDSWRFARRRYHSLARTSGSAERDLDVFDFPTRLSRPT